MTHNPPPPPPLPPQRPPSVAGAVCGHCCSDDRWILHNVRHRGLYRKLCTSCVLKLNPTSFCPTCFSLHEPTTPLSPLTGKTLTCFKCSSLSHITCVPANAPKSPYLCPPCTNPNFKYFDVRKPKKDPDFRGQSDGGDCSEQFIDEKAARVLLAAARVAAGSINKAVALARVEMERKIKESVVAKKRAKEAIDLVMLLSTRLSIRPCPNPSPRTSAVPMKVDKNGVKTGRASNGGVACSVLQPEVKNAGGPRPDGAVSGHLQSNGCGRSTNSGDKNREGGGKDGTKA